MFWITNLGRMSRAKFSVGSGPLRKIGNASVVSWEKKNVIIIIVNFSKLLMLFPLQPPPTDGYFHNGKQPFFSFLFIIFLTFTTGKGYGICKLHTRELRWSLALGRIMIDNALISNRLWSLTSLPSHTYFSKSYNRLESEILTSERRRLLQSGILKSCWGQYSRTSLSQSTFQNVLFTILLILLVSCLSGRNTCISGNWLCL